MSRISRAGSLALIVVLIGVALPGAVDSAGGDELITASDGDALDGFGRALAIDGSTLAVGAPAARGAALESGAVYVYTRTAAGWVEEAVLKPAEQGIGELLGRSIDVSGDVIVAGAYGEDSAGALAGAVYVFERVAGTWTRTAKLVGGDTVSADLFGWSVAIEGDMIAVGARNHDSAGSNAGAVYVFQREGGDWTERAKLMASDASADDAFGWSLALQDERLLVGAPFNGPGAAYLFEREGGVWTEVASLAVAGAAADDQVARSVALQGETALLGAPRDSANGDRSGAAYVFSHSAGGWAEAARLAPAESEAGDEFGGAVAVGDGVIAVGAALDDAPERDAGSTTIFRREGDAWVELARWVAPEAVVGDQFGAAISLSGSQLALGIPGDDTRGGSAGAALVRTIGREQILQPGWNLVAWSQPAPATEVASSIVGSLGAMFAWDAGTQRFLRYAHGAPAFLNDLDEVPARAGLWIQIAATQPATWTVPFGSAPGVVDLSPGFNLVAWTGADSTPVAAAVASLGSNLRALFLWDAEAQRFLSYRPQLPATLNSAELLRVGDGVWIDVGTATVWDQTMP